MIEEDTEPLETDSEEKGGMVMVNFALSVHTPAFSGDLEVKSMKKEKLDDGISRLVQIWTLSRGNRQKFFRYLR